MSPGAAATRTLSKRYSNRLHALPVPAHDSAVAIGRQRPLEPRIATGAEAGLPLSQTRQ